ncbi:hypothetical protein [Pseudonocardia sp. TRM90224]|uniref:hypothetical protein n=1 Tax=Pseudonocardia sp. TRM90224 TaxID=2812678 RepID=UPI001E4FD362|nr:hypothetical protein [Pseudonocardia sp. TRM90224]
MTTALGSSVERIRERYRLALDTAHEACVEGGAAGGLVTGPGGYAYASHRRLAACSRWIAVPIRQLVAESTGVACVRLPAAGPEQPSPEFGRRLLVAHADAVGAVARHAVDDLAGRTAEGRPLLARQLVQVAVADAVMLANETAGIAAQPEADAIVLATAFHRLVRGGRVLLRLFGGAGFLRDGPGGVLVTAELVGTLYLSGHRDG